MNRIHLNKNKNTIKLEIYLLMMIKYYQVIELIVKDITKRLYLKFKNQMNYRFKKLMHHLKLIGKQYLYESSLYHLK